MKQFIWTICLLLILLLTACNEFLEPVPDNSLTREQILEDPSFAEGLLINAYLNMPNGYLFDEVATDDAIANNPNSSFANMAAGEWSASFNPVGGWNGIFETLYYINLFLDTYQEVDWAPLSGENIATLHQNRLEGESHGLRAWFMYELLQRHAGIGTNGDLLGFPIITTPLTPEDDLELPRDSYEACVNQIIADLDIAISRLPNRYEDGASRDSIITFGEQWTNRINRRAAQALKAKVLLHAASPAFNEGDNTKWAAAAEAAGELINEMGGLSSISPNGLDFYMDANRDDDEILWRREFFSTNNWEEQNFPPSYFGRGLVNPSQNLVDAFPMINGFPITNPNSNYDQNNPYLGRDPRLDKFILYNGSIFKGAPINTFVGAPEDGINDNPFATKSGYYLLKLLDPTVSADPVSPTNSNHFYTLFRMTEVLLMYAEAANEAYGPDSDPNGFGFTARDVIGVLRQRAGIDQPDEYLTSLGSTDDMRTLIRNERRLELCFEGFRFWDIRRWDLDLTEPARGVFITNGGQPTYDVQEVAARNYQPFMKYGPIPFNEILKYNIIQNQGW